MLTKAIVITIRLATIALLVSMFLQWIPNIAVNIPVVSWLALPIAKVLNIVKFWLPGFDILITLALAKITLSAAHKGSSIAFRVIGWIFTVTE